MAHVDPAVLRKHPILGVLVGGAAAVVIGWLLASGSGEARALLDQKTPDRISLHEIVNLRGIRWVTLTDGQWHCERAITTERPMGLERWVRGPIETTEVPVTGTIAGEVLVASFDGDVTCAQRAGSTVSGVVGSTEIFTSQAALRRWSRGGDRVVILHVGATPRMALIMLVGLIGVAVLGIGVAGHYLTLMLRSGSEG